MGFPKSSHMLLIYSNFELLNGGISDYYLIAIKAILEY